MMNKELRKLERQQRQAEKAWDKEWKKEWRQATKDLKRMEREGVRALKWYKKNRHRFI